MEPSESAIRLVVGLGNPGPAYANTRHNLGFDLLNAWADKLGVPWKLERRFRAEVAEALIGNRKVILAKPQTFMNLSGEAIGPLARYARVRPEDLLVVSDEFQLPLAKPKLSFAGSAGGHNGLANLIQHLGPNFWRLRVGIAPAERSPMAMHDFVLGKFTEAERATVLAELPRLLEGLAFTVDGPPHQAMNRLNNRLTTHHERSHPPPIPRDDHLGHPGL